MGNKVTTFSEQQLEDYQVCESINQIRCALFVIAQYTLLIQDATFFSRKDILRYVDAVCLHAATKRDL